MGLYNLLVNLNLHNSQALCSNVKACRVNMASYPALDTGHQPPEHSTLAVAYMEISFVQVHSEKTKMGGPELDPPISQKLNSCASLQETQSTSPSIR